MHTLKTLMLKISASLILIFSTIAPSSAQEVNTSNFSGTVNTTVSSGLTIRTERDCSNLDGYSFTSALGTYVDGSGAGCATSLTDAYGNTTTKQLSRNAGQTDDGSMNFDEGAVVSAKQKVFTELSGTTSNGIGVNLSFTGFIDPALDLNSPEYAPLSKRATDDFERNFDILNAYAYGSSDLANGNYIDWTIGRQVTNWGEATFIPIGMNGLTTNALDLTKLRGPGSSIREALVPTGQITASTSLGDGISLEAFYQVEHTPLVLDPAGSFYGNELVGTGSYKMITSGNYKKENVAYDACSFSDVGQDTTACTAASIAAARTTAGIQAHDTTYHLTTGLKGLTQTEVAAGVLAGASKTFGVAANLTTHAGSSWTDLYTAGLNAALGSKTQAGHSAGGANIIGTGATGVDKTFFTSNTTGYKLTTIAGLAANSYLMDSTGATTTASFGDLDTSDRLIDDALNTYAAVSIRKSNNFITDARDDGQFGARLSGYSDAGQGFDWSLNYSRFHSKVPYTRIKGKGGIYAGDIYGALAAAGDTAEADRTTAQDSLVKVVKNVAYSGGVCDAAMGAALASATYAGADPTGAFWNAAQKAFVKYDGTAGSWDTGISTAQKNLSDQFNWEDTINGKAVHNSAKCYSTASAFTAGKTAAFDAGDIDAAVDVHAALNDTAEVLTAAITPLNTSQYELFYPEDLDVIGFSFNTNFSGTAVQGEITYRPEFPLATSTGDQVSQIGDATGAYDVLDMFAFDTLTKGVVDNTNTEGTDLDTIVAGAAISTNFYDPSITVTSDQAAYIQQGVRMQLIGNATISAQGLVSVSSTVLPSGAGLQNYKNWMGSTNSSSTAVLGLANIRKGIFDMAYIAACSKVEAATVCSADTLGAGDYDANYYTDGLYGDLSVTVGAAYEAGTVAFNRSSLPALSRANTVSDYYSTPFIEKDVWSFDLGTTTSFNASHPITASIGADSSALLTEIGAVAIAGLDNAADGYIARRGYQEGIGNEKCLGPFGAAVGGGYTFGGAVAGITHLGAGQVDALFGNGGYCEDQSGADDFSMTYRVIGTATYNNVNNTAWSLSPTIVWAHDAVGYGPASLGGFVEDKMTMALSLNARKGAAITMGLNYTNNLHGPEVDSSSDRDTLTASVSYAF